MYIFSLNSRCGFSFKNNYLKMLVVFSAIFVAETKIIFRYDFAAPSNFREEHVLQISRFLPISAKKTFSTNSRKLIQSEIG